MNRSICRSRWSARGSRAALPGAAGLTLLSLLVGCQAAVPASLLLTVTNGPDAPAAATLRVRVFDRQGLAHEQAQFVVPAPAAEGRFGTLVIYPGPAGSLALRVQAQGVTDEMVVSEGALVAVLAGGQQRAAELVLKGPSRGPDGDGDGVLDEIDNCPAFANPTQTDSDGDGLGDDCRPGDGGAPDAGEDAGEDGGEGLPLGARCTDPADCAGGRCVDGVCCESACTDSCRACNLAGQEGRCAPVSAGEPDPQQRCPAEAPESCGLDGTCNGAGACRKHRVGTVCGVPSCSSSVERVLPALCDGAGICQPPGTQSCAPYACAAAECKTVCSGNQDCAAGGTCVNGSCGRKPLGSPCTAARDCNSNQCVDGVCCDVADCSGPCRACNLPGAQGSCRSLPANAEPRAAGCAPEEVSTCGRTGKCDGAGACQLQAPGTLCGARTCAASVQTEAPACNGSGGCLPGRSQSCGNYACTTDVCATTCTSDAHCAPAFYCGGQKMCRARGADGTACAEGRECLSGFCVLARCCATATCL